NLGKELVNCESKPVTIHANYANSTYMWSTGETADSIIVSTPGVYALTINNKCGTQTDSVHVYIQPPTPPPAPADTVICQFVKNPAIHVTGADIRWYTHVNGTIGSKHQPPIVTREPGSYALFISQTIGKCESSKVPVNVDVIYSPHEELGDKAVMCETDIKIIGTPMEGVEYDWNPGSTAGCLKPDREGLYELAMTNTCGNFIASIWVYHTECNACLAF